MHQMMKSAFLLTAIMLSSCFTAVAGAEPIYVAISAQVATIDDQTGLLAGVVRVGDIITGTYVYDSGTVDTNTLTTVGDYLHTQALYGITLNVGGLLFRTDPDKVGFLVEIVNDYGYPASDNYLLRSYNNIFPISAPPGIRGKAADNQIAWQLDDPTLTALTSAALPTTPPVLANWKSVFGLTIDSRNGSIDSFSIRAHVTSATLINYCPDKDGDGYAVCTPGCELGGKQCGDCNDSNASVYPTAPESCDGMDNNCDGRIDEGFDKDGDGYTACGGDCNDGNASINPAATELCDGTDNNCNGRIDEGFDKDGDGYTTCGGDCNDSKFSINPGVVENCKDKIDNNCNGLIDIKDLYCKKRR